MSMKCKRNLVEKLKENPNISLRTSTACSVMKFKAPTEADHLENLQVLCTKCHRAKTKTDLKVLSRMR